MKKIIFVFFVLFSLLKLFPEELIIAGSGTNEGILMYLAQAFMKDNPGIIITVPPSIGTDGAINGCANGKFMLGRIGRPLKDNEKEMGLKEILFCKIPVVFFVHEMVNVKNLTVSQICDIYQGKITNWKEVGGPDKKIYVITRDKGDSSLVEIEKKIEGFKEITVSGKAIVAHSDPEMVEKVAGKDGTIGFTTITNIYGKKVKYLSINGVSPANDSYKILLISGFVYSKPYNDTAKRFIDFTFSKKGIELISNLNCIPINKI